MEKIRKIDVGTLHGYDSHSVFEDNIRKRSYMYFENGGHFDDSSHIFDLHGQHCYIVSKDDLDAYMAHKESLEKTKGTPDWYLSNRIKQLEAENANLRDINKSLGERAAEVEELKERIDHLKIIQRLLAKENTSLLTENNKLRGTCNELNATVTKLRQDLAKFYGEHTVEFLYEKHEAGKHIIGWTEVSGEEYELTFLTPERKIHE